MLIGEGIDLKDGEKIKPYYASEVEGYNRARIRSGREIIISGSPGDSTPLSEATHIQRNMEMFRITKDQYDLWSDVMVQFVRAHEWAPYCVKGAWADLDALPFGKIMSGATPDYGVRFTRLSYDEILSSMTLHCMARSPLITYSDPCNLDLFTKEVLTNKNALDACRNGSNQHQFYNDGNIVKWINTRAGTGIKYLAIFNITSASIRVKQSLSEIGYPNGCRVKDIWNKSYLETSPDSFTVRIAGHGVGFYRVWISGSLPNMCF
jgi:hypothetical protein